MGLEIFSFWYRLFQNQQAIISWAESRRYPVLGFGSFSKCCRVVHMCHDRFQRVNLAALNSKKRAPVQGCAFQYLVTPDLEGKLPARPLHLLSSPLCDDSKYTEGTWCQHTEEAGDTVGAHVFTYVA